MEMTKSVVAECHQSEQRNIKSKRREFAPLASFEDLEEFKPKNSNLKKQNCLPLIEDNEPGHQDPGSSSKAGISTQAHQTLPTESTTQRPETIRPIPAPVLVDDTGSDNITPPTPRIDISCASSSSTISDEISSSEKELRRYGLGLDCNEEVDDLRSSTEEIAFEESSLPQEILNSKRIAIENLRRGSHPTNIFSRKVSTVTISDCFTRKPSVYSLHADAVSPRTGRHSSFGGSSSPRPKSCAPSPTPTCRSGRRSVSPHLIMFETSFCGSKPTPIDYEADIYAPELVTSEAQVHSPQPSCDNPPLNTTTKAQVEREPSPPPTSSSPPRPSTSKSLLKSMGATWCERFVVPNQPSMDDDRDDEVSEKVCLDERIDQPVVLNHSTKDESTDFSDKETKLDENISDVDIGNEEVQNDKILPPNDDVSTPQETKGLFFDVETLDEESNLPYVPTTLPLEKSAALPIVPVRDRVGQFAPTTPIQRPRSTQPPNLTSIQDYITVNSHESKKAPTTEKMKISLPKEDSLGDEPKTPKKEIPTTWTDFAEMGLRNPRNLRRQVQEESK